jgi:hypothetical protein
MDRVQQLNNPNCNTPSSQLCRIQLLCSLQKHNLEISKIVGIVADSVPSIIGSENGMASIYKCLHELYPQNE